MIADDLPTAYATLTWDWLLELWHWTVRDCPYCHGTHVHGGGHTWQNPRNRLTDRAALCRLDPETRYQLIEAGIEGEADARVHG